MPDENLNVHFMYKYTWKNSFTQLPTKNKIKFIYTTEKQIQSGFVTTTVKDQHLSKNIIYWWNDVAFQLESHMFQQTIPDTRIAKGKKTWQVPAETAEHFKDSTLSVSS